MKVRLAQIDDAEAIRAIYNLEVTTSTATFDLVERTLKDQQAWLVARSGAHTTLVAVDDAGAVVGFAAFSPYRDRPAYRTTVEDSVYVRRDHHGQGIGQLLLAELVEAAAMSGFHAMMARIVGDHEASIALHKGQGFTIVGTEREVGRKFSRWLDVVIMQRLL
ncbi:MAG: N-acetyltransferase family protein [Acidimicrobiales bacterium]